MNMIGALVFAVIGFFRSRSQQAERIAVSFIPRPGKQPNRGEANQGEAKLSVANQAEL